MEHHICTGGCGGVSEQPGVCQTQDCPKQGQPLTLCSCEDGKHAAGEAEKETPAGQ